MITRNELLGEAVDRCLKELYEYVTPQVEWDDFMQQNKEYSEKYREWEHNRENHPEWEGKRIDDCIGPRPFEMYYLPKEIMREICDSYIYTYKIDSKQNLLDIIKILKDYCKKPIVDKYIDDYTDEYGNHHPGYRDYDHPDNLEKQLYDLVPDTGFDKSEMAKGIQNKFFEFLDMAGNFFNWNTDLNSFNMSVYLGPSPNSNKEAVIKNWKKYKNQDIEIDEEQIKKNFYGEDD